MEIPYETLTLITINGDEIKIEFPNDIAEDIYQELSNVLQSESDWNIDNYPDTKATYKGRKLFNINMKQIIGYN